MALSEYEAKQLLAEAGVPVVREQLAGSKQDAVAAADDIGYPVILKADSREVQHKTDIGAVMTAHTAEEVAARYDRIMENVEQALPDASVDGVLVEEQLDGRELIVGVQKDPDFGHVLMFGLGGIFVEVLQDVHFRVIPANREDAEALIDEMQTKALLEGVRGEEPADTDAIVDVLLSVSAFVEQHPSVEELDINPLFANSEGAVAADALIVMGDEHE